MKKVILSLVVLGFVSYLPATASADSDVAGIDIKTYLNDLRKQFIELSNTKEKNELPMYIDKITVELNVVAKMTGSAGVKFYVLDAGGAIENAVTQKLKFDLWLGGKPGVGSVVYRGLPYYRLFGLTGEDDDS